jgi:predicted RNA binding protein YcfA (HicA-like mRNA interferase family)
MPPLPIVSSEEAIRAFVKAGWLVNRHKGSHTTLTQAGSIVVLTVARRKEMPRGTLRALIRAAGLTVEEFVELLKK